MKIYAPEVQVNSFKDWFGDSDPLFERCDDLNTVLAQPLKIACIPMYYSKLGRISHQQFDLVLVSDIEYSSIHEVQTWLKTYSMDQRSLLALGGVGGFGGNPKVLPSNIIYRPWWTFNLMSFNTDEYQERDSKPFVFDMLLGAKKAHRDWILSKSIEHGLEEQSICSYRNCFPAPDITDPDLARTMGKFTAPYPFMGTNMSNDIEVSDTITNQVSSIVPWKIYDQSRYSILPETHYRYDSFFFSEKPAKILMARRLFVAFSNYEYLKNMRELLGFQTFDNVIDESYDNEKNDSIRFYMAFEQMLKLSKMDYREVQEATRPAREHNFNRLYSLRTETKAQMRKMVLDKLAEMGWDENKLC